MNVQRRGMLALAAGAAALSGLAVAPTARAQAYPARPVRLVVASASGGVTDITARLIGEALSRRLGQPLVIDNRAGAGGVIGTEAVVRAAADGYTLLMVTSANAIDATLQDKLSYDLLRDLVPVAGLTQSANLLVVHPSLPARTIPEFIAYAKANAERIHAASAGNGTTQHLSAELFNLMAGTAMRHVPYRGGALAMTDLLGGHVQAMFAPVGLALKQVSDRKLRALGVTSSARLPLMPDLPAVGEFLPGFDVVAWFGIGAPRQTPVEIVNRLDAEVAAVLADPAVKARLVEMGAMPFPRSPEAFRRFIGEEVEKWARVVRFAGLKPG